jgi:hypothetical protein
MGPPFPSQLTLSHKLTEPEPVEPEDTHGDIRKKVDRYTENVDTLSAAPSRRPSPCSSATSIHR